MFKVGDKIRLKEEKAGDYIYVEKDKVYTIEYFSNNNIKLKELDAEIYFYRKDYELAQEEEAVNHPSHYNQGIETIDVIESWGLNFSLGNAIKYILRAPHKGKELEDLRKAKWYLEREIKRLENIAKEEPLVL